MTKEWNDLEEQLRREMPALLMKRHASMAEYTTLHLGGTADLLLEPASEEEVQQILRTAAEHHAPVTVIGHGSNLLVRSGGIRGVVLRIANRMSQISVEGETLHAQAGAMMPAVASTAANHCLAGLTFASGIPGTVGGGALMNAGAYGGEMSQLVTEVAGFDRLTGEPFRYTGEEMHYGYRTSRLQQEDKVITSVTLHLHIGDRDALRKEMSELNARRREKQPLDVPSAGSTFRRPANGFAAALIDQCGLKGASVGGAQVSEKHAGFLVNRGGTPEDFLALMTQVKENVLEKTGVCLEPEVCILGEENDT
jgi:UDP-N-acetylmuramate dehydrogenase